MTVKPWEVQSSASLSAENAITTNQKQSKKGRYKPMKKTTIKEVGTINVEGLEVAEGVIEMRMPVEVISEQFNTKLDEVLDYYKKNNPQIEQENIFYEARLVFQFGRSDLEFSLMLIVFDKDYQGKDEIWDELEVTLSEDAKKQIRKIAWNKLGEALFNL